MDCWMEPYNPPIDRYKSCVFVSEYVVLLGVTEAQEKHIEVCVMHMIRLINDLIAVTWTKQQQNARLALELLGLSL